MGDYASGKARQLRHEGREEEARAWDEGGANRALAHAFVGGMTGDAQGAGGAVLASGAAPALDDLTQDLPDGVWDAVGAGIAAGLGLSVGGTAGAAAGLNEDLNNRILHADDKERGRRLAGASNGKYSEEEIQSALRWAGVRDADGKVVYPAGSQQSYSQQTGQTYGAESPNGTVAGDLTYDPGLTLRPDGQALTETSPPAPSRELMDYVVKGTGGLMSPYFFSTSGMTYGPSPTPLPATCATAECAAGSRGLKGEDCCPTTPLSVRAPIQ